MSSKAEDTQPGGTRYNDVMARGATVARKVNESSNGPIASLLFMGGLRRSEVAAVRHTGRRPGAHEGDPRCRARESPSQSLRRPRRGAGRKTPPTGGGTRMTRCLTLMLFAVLSAACSPAGDTISADTWTDGPWPLTVPTAMLLCEPGPAAIVETPDGERFQLNGLASQPRYRTRPLEDIWLTNPESPDFRIDIRPMINRALMLCD